MKLLKKLILTLGFAVIVAAPVMTVTVPQTAMAAGPTCDNRILGMPTWFRGLTDADCNIVSPGGTLNGTKIELGDFIWHIALNIIEIGLFLAGYACIGFVLFGGFLYLTGGSEPAQTEKARKTLLNAVIGLAISTAAIGATNLIFRIING